MKNKIWFKIRLIAGIGIGNGKSLLNEFVGHGHQGHFTILSSLYQALVQLLAGQVATLGLHGGHIEEFSQASRSLFTDMSGSLNGLARLMNARSQAHKSDELLVMGEGFKSLGKDNEHQGLLGNLGRFTEKL